MFARGNTWQKTSNLIQYVGLVIAERFYFLEIKGP